LKIELTKKIKVSVEDGEEAGGEWLFQFKKELRV
jgi:hypothetical protein